MASTKIWAHSGDSHLIEPFGLFDKLPEHARAAMPRSVKNPEAGVETIYVDGQSFERALPQRNPDKPRSFGLNARPEDGFHAVFLPTVRRWVARTGTTKSGSRCGLPSRQTGW